jgi:hypothetical protein
MFRRLDSVSVSKPTPGISQEIGTSSIDWVQLSKFYLKTEKESRLRNIAF